MHLTEQERDKLLIFVAAELARQRLDRGLLLNYPEAVALISSFVTEEARAGARVSAVMESARHVLSEEQVMPGVAEMVHEVQVEATFPDGTKLVTVHTPILPGPADVPGSIPLPGTPDSHLVASSLGAPHTRLDASSLSAAAAIPNPDATGISSAALAQPTRALIPGEYQLLADAIEVLPHRRRVTVTVHNGGDRPVQVGSHYHFSEVNSALELDREVAKGFRLDIPSGTAVRFEPGDTRDVTLVEYGGDKEPIGFQGRGAAIPGHNPGAAAGSTSNSSNSSAPASPVPAPSTSATAGLARNPVPAAAPASPVPAPSPTATNAPRTAGDPTNPTTEEEAD